MALRQRGLFLLNPFPANFCGQSGTARNLSAATHWIGTRFQAPKTGTITEVLFRTGTSTSPNFTLQAGVVNVDANGDPLGSDISVVDAVTNPTANTMYTASVSASVTAGEMYGLIVRMKSGGYTSGAINVSSVSPGDYMDNAAVTGDWNYGGGSYNLGTTTKDSFPSMVVCKYSDGFVESPHMVPFRSGGITLTSSAQSGAVIGNKITTTRKYRIAGYMLWGDTDACTVATFAGSDNTPVANSEVAINASYRAVTSAAAGVFMVASPFILYPGTYRIGLKNTSTTTNQLRRCNLITPGQLALIGMDGFMQTSYASGAWTDDDTALCAIMPIIDAAEDGIPPAQWQLGM